MIKPKLKWFKDKHGSLWTCDIKSKEIYTIFENRDKEFVIGIYRNIRVKRNGELIGNKPLFYDGFTLSKAKRIVREIIKISGKKICL